MADKVTAGKFVVGVAVVLVLKVVGMVLLQTLRVLANTIVYFGLYVPFFYFILGGVFVGIGAFSFSVVSINMVLFYVGLALCFGVSVCIFVRSYGHKPVRSVVQGSVAAVRAAAQRPQRLAKRRVVADNEVEIATANRPLSVYYSQENPNHLVHEYEDYFDVFYDDHVHPVSYLWRIDKPKRTAGV